MKSSTVVVALVLCSSLVKDGASGGAVLTSSPNRTHLYPGEAVALTCETEGNFSDAWTYSWFKHGIGTPATPGASHRVNRHVYSISAVTSGDGDTYWCGASKQGTNSTVLSNPVTLRVMSVNSTDDSQDEETSSGVWVWPVCVTVVILLLIPVTLMLVPKFRNRIKFLPLTQGENGQQEMPRTKQDVTEIQWDLGWMEMSNLLDKPNLSS